jgi:hypothetical protein
MRGDVPERTLRKGSRQGRSSGSRGTSKSMPLRGGCGGGGCPETNDRGGRSELRLVPGSDRCGKRSDHLTEEVVVARGAVFVTGRLDVRRRADHGGLELGVGGREHHRRSELKQRQ